MTLGEKIQFCRKKMGLSQEDLANLLNISRQAVQKWESDSSIPELDKLIRLTKEFHVSLDCLVNDSEKRNEGNISQQETQPNTISLNQTHLHIANIRKIISLILIFLHFGGIFLVYLLVAGAGGVAYAIGFNLISIVGYILLYKKKISKIGTICFVVFQTLSVTGSLVGGSSFGEAILYGLLENVVYASAMGLLCYDNLHSGDVYNRIKVKTSEQLEKERLENETRAKEKEQKRKNAEGRQKLYELRCLKRDALHCLLRTFKKQKYNPKDKKSAQKEFNRLSSEIFNIQKNSDMDQIIDQYKIFLEKFKVDLEYYKRRSKILLKFCVIFTSISVLTGSGIIIGFKVARAKKEKQMLDTYSDAVALMVTGDYERAYEYFSKLEGYKNSESKMLVCSGLSDLKQSMTDLTEESIISGIKKIVKGGENVGVNYNLDDKKIIRNSITEYIETISTESFKFYSPQSLNGYSFLNWETIDFNYSSNQTHLYLRSVWSVVDYDISYVLGGGQNDSRNPLKYNIETESFNLYPASRNGYIFEGWYLESTFLNKITSVSKGSHGNYSLYAKWKPIQYSITYNLNNGINDDSNPSYYTIEDSFNFKNPSRVGYSFGGWFNSNNQQITHVTLGSTGNIILNANWTANSYNIFLNANSGTVNPSVMNVTYDGEYTLPEPSRTGYLFTGWYNETDLFPNEGIYSHASNLTLIASWEAINYSITYHLNGGINDDSNPSVFTVEDSFTFKQASRIGFTFVGWYRNEQLTQKITSYSGEFAENLELYAKWSGNKYSVNLFASHDPCRICFETNGANESISDQIVDADNPIQYPGVLTKDNCIFKGWYEDSLCTTLYDFAELITGDRTLYAGWQNLSGGQINYLDMKQHANEEQYFATEQHYIRFTALADGLITLKVKLNYTGDSAVARWFDYNIFEVNGTSSLANGEFKPKGNTLYSYCTITFNAFAGIPYTLSIGPHYDYSNRTMTVYFENFEEQLCTGDTYYQSKQLVYGQSFTLPMDFSRNGYEFIGYFDENGVQYTDGQGASVIDWNKAVDSNLFAHWNIIV